LHLARNWKIQVWVYIYTCTLCHYFGHWDCHIPLLSAGCCWFQLERGIMRPSTIHTSHGHSGILRGRWLGRTEGNREEWQVLLY